VAKKLRSKSVRDMREYIGISQSEECDFGTRILRVEQVSEHELVTNPSIVEHDAGGLQAVVDDFDVGVPAPVPVVDPDDAAEKP
jgi:hypothetical protein